MGLLTKIFGTYSDHELKKIYPIADKIEALEEEYKALLEKADGQIETILSKLRGETEPHTSNSFEEREILGDILLRAAQGSQTTTAIGKAFAKEGYSISKDSAALIRQLYKDEFRVGLKANEIVKEETGVEFTDDEAAFIALHFVNAQLGGEIRDIYDMTYLMKAVFGIVYEEYGFRPDHESLNYYRFVTHLKFYARRIVSGEKYGDEDADLLEVVRFKYPRAYACADRIRAYVQTEKGFHSGQNELLYLTIHIARVMEHPDEK